MIMKSLLLLLSLKVNHLRARAGLVGPVSVQNGWVGISCLSTVWYFSGLAH